VRAEEGRPSQAAAIGAEIASDPDTGRSVALGQTTVAIQGVGSIQFVGYEGDASWIGYALIQGRWFAGPGEVVAPTNVLRQTGLHVGDQLVVTGSSGPVTVRLVGEIFDQAEESRDGLVLRGAWADLAALDTAATPDRWEIAPKSGVSPDELRSSLITATNQALPIFVEGDASGDANFLLFLSVVGFMGLVLVAMSVGGVLNTVLLETRQRTRELAILKAIGLTPRQVVATVVASVLGLGLVAGAIGVPLGLAIRHAVLDYMAETAAHLAVPDSSFDVLTPLVLVGLALSGVAIAIAGAFLPALRAARLRVAPVLQAE
jgi:putative ABC transport system permease protein